MNVSSEQCEEFLDNITLLFTPTKQERNLSDAANQQLLIKHIINDYALVIVCVFGIIGNILNLIVLTRKQLQCTMDRMEKSAHLGLLALAISDMCFCTLALMVAFLPSKLTFTNRDFIGIVYYKIYHQPLLNIFLITSTWLTVIMALGRYVAICHPLHARGFINLNGTRAAIICVFIGSVLVNLPQFWYSYVAKGDCSTDGPPGCACRFYSKASNSLRSNYTFVLGYNICYSIIGIFIPLIILTYCNVCLIKALRQSFKMQQMYRANQPKDSGQRITPTLITIIILFTILVSPSELLKFFENFITKSKSDSPKFLMYQNATEITNFMMVINFAINFVLYCVINVQFRRTVRDIVCCKCASRKSKYVKANHHEQTNMTMTCNVSDIETEM